MADPGLQDKGRGGAGEGSSRPWDKEGAVLFDNDQD